MIGALVFCNPGRPVAARRRRSRSRTARTTGKEIRMARSRTRRRGRRRITRNAKGHFVSRRRRSRRRNPSGFIKVGRRWKKITKYARRRRKGRRKGQIRGFRFPKRYRRSRSRRRRVRANPVVFSNPGRRRRRRSVRHNPRRRYRRNPGTFRLAADPLKAIKSAIMDAFSQDTIVSIVQTGVGFGTALGLSKIAVAKLFDRKLDTPIGRPLTTLAVSVLGTALVGVVTKNARLTSRFMAGSLLATFWQALSEAIKTPGSPLEKLRDYVPTLGDDSAFRKSLEREVLRQMRGGNGMSYVTAAGAEGVVEYIRPAGVENTYLTPAGQEAYLTESQGENVSGYLTGRETDTVEAVGVAGTEDATSSNWDEFSRASMPERF